MKNRNFGQYVEKNAVKLTPCPKEHDSFHEEIDHRVLIPVPVLDPDHRIQGVPAGYASISEVVRLE